MAGELDGRALLECGGDVGFGRLEGGEDAESDAAGYGECEGEECGVPVDGPVRAEGRARGQAGVGGDGRESPGQGESCRAAEEGEENAFGDHLANETEAAGADGEANGEFFAAAGAAGEGHGGEIEAGDGGDDGHERGVEAEDFRAELAGDLHAGACSHEDYSSGFVGLGRGEGIVFVEAAGDAVEGGFGGVDGDAGGEAHEELEGFQVAVVEHVVAELGSEGGGHGDGDEDLSGIAGESAVKFAGGDADDGGVLSVEADGLADDVRVGVEVAAPVAIADDHGWDAAGFVEVGAEEAAALRLHAEDGEIIRGDELSVNAVGLRGLAGEGDVELNAVLDSGDSGEEVLLVTVALDVGV